MRVLIISETFLAEENHKQLIALADSTGEPIHVISPKSTKSELHEYNVSQETISSQHFTIHFLRPWPFKNNHVRSILLGLYRIIDMIQPDLVHLEISPWSIPALQFFTGQILKRSRIHFTGLIRQPIFTLKLSTGGRLKIRIAQWALGNLDIIIAATYVAQKNIMSALKLTEKKHSFQVVYPLGVDTNWFRPRTPKDKNDSRKRMGIGEDRVIIGYCGRFIEEKGLSDLIHALGLVNVKKKHTALTLALLGQGPFLDSLKKLAQKESVDLVVLPKVPHADVVYFLHALDVFVLPSRRTKHWIEHDAHSIVEAMACKIPVVGSDSGVIPEIVDNGGLIYPIHDYETLSERIIQILENKEMRDQLVKNGYKRALEKYSIKSTADMTVNVWEKSYEKCNGKD